MARAATPQTTTTSTYATATYTFVAAAAAAAARVIATARTTSKTLEVLTKNATPLANVYPAREVDKERILKIGLNHIMMCQVCKV